MIQAAFYHHMYMQYAINFQIMKNDNNIVMVKN